MDVNKEKSILSCFKKLKKNGIKVDILINNATINPTVSKISNNSKTRLEHFSLKKWNEEISVGLTGTFLCSKIFGNEMSKNKKGIILNILSDLSVIAPDQTLYNDNKLKKNQQPVKPITYSAIKFGLLGMTKYLATYWAGTKIRCNALSPGGVFDGQNKEFVKKLTKSIPMGRMAQRTEYRSAVQFLCSDASSYMNGHNLVMDGGRTIW
jgi:NAD(P)-dependent dehydrogenase (short-subunit alcohol dehydrogenase family)